MEKRKIALVALVCIALLAVGSGVCYYFSVLSVDPEKAIVEAMESAARARGYRYTVMAEFTIEGKKRDWIQVSGERSRDNKAHFKGKILGTPVEVYQIGMRSYTLDPVANKWIIIDGVDLDRQQLYMAELDPLSSFRFKGIENARLLRTERVGGKRCWVIEVRPLKAQSKVLDMYWKDITYRFWVDRGRVLRKAVATAKNKNSPGTLLTLIVEFRDFNKRIDINPPQ
ncbi:MAG: hypothetical protein ACPLTR_07705 [Thermacetogeniaceae bacterium]